MLICFDTIESKLSELFRPFKPQKSSNCSTIRPPENPTATPEPAIQRKSYLRREVTFVTYESTVPSPRPNKFQQPRYHQTAPSASTPAPPFRLPPPPSPKQQRVVVAPASSQITAPDPSREISVFYNEPPPLSSSGNQDFPASTQPNEGSGGLSQSVLVDPHSPTTAINTPIPHQTGSQECFYEPPPYEEATAAVPVSLRGSFTEVCLSDDFAVGDRGGGAEPFVTEAFEPKTPQEASVRSASLVFSHSSNHVVSDEPARSQHCSPSPPSRVDVCSTTDKTGGLGDLASNKSWSASVVPEGTVQGLVTTSILFCLLCFFQSRIIRNVDRVCYYTNTQSIVFGSVP